MPTRIINTLSKFEKRQIIFSYLCKTVRYDYELLDKIKNSKTIRISRNPREEFRSAVFDSLGICSAISQYYKLLLEEVEIKSYCVVCDDGTSVNHELTLVYDDDNDTYSFDDVTSVIVKLGSEQDFFDYDLEYANSKNQGNKKVFGDEEFFVLPEGWLNYVFNRTSSCESLSKIPHNIESVKHIEEQSSMKNI